MTDCGHRTIVEAVRCEPEPIKGSRHIGSAAQVTSEAEAKGFVASVRREFGKATHHAFAWRLAPDGAVNRCSDDGEPSGTAGRPILRQLVAAELVDVCVVVTRFFGGVKLGAGGLARAYAGAAQAVLQAAEIVEVIPRSELSVRVDYPDEQVVRQSLGRHGVDEFEVAHAAQVTFTALVPAPLRSALIADLRERTQARAEIGPLEPAPPAQ